MSSHIAACRRYLAALIAVGLGSCAGVVVTSPGDAGSATPEVVADGDTCGPQCGLRECGASPSCPDQSCGTCSGETPICTDEGKCMSEACVPDCTGRQCGKSSNCNGESGPDECGTCAGAQVCLEPGGTCCTPDCTDKPCGEDGCGGVCVAECTNLWDEAFWGHSTWGD